MSAYWRAMVLLVIGVVPILATQVAGAEVGEREESIPVDPTALEGRDAVEATARVMAESSGVPMSAALAAIDHQHAMDELQQKVHALAPERYGGAIHAELPEISTTIFVKGELPAEAVSLVDGYENVTLATAPYSRAELELMSNVAAATLQEIGVREFAAWVDHRRWTVGVEVAEADLSALRLSEDDIEGRLQSAVPDDPALRHIMDAPIEVRAVASGIVAMTHTYGGDVIDTNPAGDPCTSGFVVEDIATGVDGFVTADHCNGITRYQQANGLRYNVTRQGSAATTLGDVEWYTSTHIEFDDFYYDTGAPRIDVQSLKSQLLMDVGDLVCRYGRTTGNGGCPAITAFAVAANGYHNMIRTAPTGDDDGDSGGPWFMFWEAWGVHHGHFNISGDSVFSPISFALGNMGVRLRTS